MPSKSKRWSTGIYTVFLSSFDSCLLGTLTLAESEIISTSKVQPIKGLSKLILSVAFRSWSTKSPPAVEKKICTLDTINPLAKWFSPLENILASRMMMDIVIHLNKLFEIYRSRLKPCFMFGCGWKVPHLNVYLAKICLLSFCFLITFLIKIFRDFIPFKIRIHH